MKMLTLIFLHAIFLCCISSPSSTVLGLLGNETDRLSLLAFKSQITHDPSEVLSSWNDSSHFCEWGGVTCSHRHQRVTVLSLRGKSLAGPISPHIGNLSFLRNLSLPENNFYGEIPQEIGKLSRLELLQLSNNSFVGKIPSNISFCSSLITLVLRGNNFFGNIPMEFWSLPKLRVLAVENANLTGEIPPSLGNITSLKVLSLSDNHLGGIIPTTLGQLKLLYYLSLAVNNFSGMVPPSLYNLSSLRFLSITLNHLVGNLPSAIGLTLPNLEELLIGGNNFSGPIPHSLFNASKLQKVDIGQNHFTGKVPINVGNLNDLQYINLETNDLGTRSSGDLDFISSLTNCSNLETLSIYMNQFGGSLPPSVGNFSNKFSVLLLGKNQVVGEIPYEIERLQNLYVLSMGYNSFNGDIPAGFRNLQKLQILELADNQLSGNIPSFLNNMSQLFALGLKNNFLEGSIASSLESQNLQYLDLSSNKFTGTIPKEIGFSSQLSVFDLSHNSLTGSIPLEVGNLKSLVYIGVSENKMSGSVPNIFASLLSLQYLELEGNIFQGLLPSSLGSLLDLRSLDVSNNNFSGPIPKELEKLSVLTSLNLSFNNFEGEVPTQGIFKNVSAYSVTANHKICGGIPDLGLPKCYVQKSRKRRNKLALTVTLGTIGIILIIGIFIFIYLWRKPSKELSSESRGESFMRVSYHDLFQATNGFSMTNLVGTGRYGSVYKGSLQQFERPVAVKVLNLIEAGASKTFLAECEALRVVRHRCLLKILTVCSGVDYNANDFKAIVFDFMDNGSLESWLHPTSDGQDSRRSLSLYQRLEVATSIASALDYLHNHCETPIAHCDLKPSNILLDDAMNAFVSDFGLAKFLAMTLSSSNGNEASSIAVRGTIGYIPPAGVPMENIYYLGGPNIASEIYNKEYANARICGGDKWRKVLAKFLRQPHFIVWDNSDLITHEVMGGLKNVYAIGAGMVAALTNESATSKSVYFAHCTSEMIFITHLLAEQPEKLAGPLLADTYVTLLKGRNAWYGHMLAKGELSLDMGANIKGKGMIQGVSAVAAFYELLSQSSLSVLHPEINKPVAPAELCPILKTLYKILITREFSSQAILQALRDETMHDPRDRIEMAQTHAFYKPSLLGEP